MIKQSKELGTQVASGLIWSLGEKILANGVSFLVSLILARLLMPEQYGLISLVVIFTNISSVFVESGFGMALIQSREADEHDFNTIMVFSVVFSSILYMCLFLCAPLIAKFYEEPSLIQIIRVYGISIILGGIKNIQHAYVSKKMKLKLFFYSTLGGTLVSAVVGIFMAYQGYGVWALVAQQLVNSAIDSVILNRTMGWKIKIEFSLNRLKKLYSFGWKVLACNLISSLYSNIYGLIIGKIYNKEALGMYNKGNSFPTLISNNVSGPIQTATFPALAYAQDEPLRIKQMTRKTLLTTSYILLPMLLGMAGVSEAMISILLTDKWLGCVPFVQISCIAVCFWPISSANGQAINAMGRSDISLKLDIIKKAIGISLLLVSVPFGVYAMALGRAISLIIESVINSYPNKQMISYGYLEQIKDLFKTILSSSIMLIGVRSVMLLQWNDFITLVAQISIGLFIYLICSILFKLEGFLLIYTYLKKLFIKKRI